MKKLPLAFSGCLLGLAGAGNLILDIFPLLSHVFSLLGLILWFYFLYSHLSDWKESEQELKKAPVLSGMATFPMAGMILSTYLLRILSPNMSIIAQILWWFAFLMDVFLIFCFTKNYVLVKPRASATPTCWDCLWSLDFWFYLNPYPLPSDLSRFEGKSITAGFTRTRRDLLCSFFPTFSCSYPSWRS